MNLSTLNQKSLKYLYIIMGIVISLLWIALFMIGLLVDSDYYRVAINYRFADCKDLLYTFISFTLSNVALLAFLSGLLGGITSRLIYSHGFRMSRDEILSNNVHPSLIENPAISGIRGIIIFIGLLSIQYASSFSDFSQNKSESQPSLNEIASINQKGEIIRNEEISNGINNNIPFAELGKLTNEFNIIQVKKLKYDLLHAKTDYSKFYIENEIEKYRRKIKPPADTDFGSITLQSYFKFAIIASLLSFIMGYDPRKFNSFLKQLPGAGAKEEHSQTTK